MHPKRLRPADAPTTAAGPTAETFLSLPLSCLPPASPEQLRQTEELHRRAFEQAQAVLQPSLPERDLLAVWN
jgi:hypothetical protein